MFKGTKLVISRGFEATAYVGISIVESEADWDC